MERIPMTQENYDNQLAELDRLRNVEMRDITDKVADAREEGDLKENAEYHASRERQGHIQAKIDYLKDRIARAQIIRPEDLSTDTVVFGSRVKIVDVETGEEEVYELVGPGDEDYDLGRILATSPRGKALLGKKVGDKAEVKAPRRTFVYKVVEVEQTLV